MKKLMIPLIAIALVGLAFTKTDKKANDSLEIGTVAPMQDYQMKDVSSKMMSLKDLKQDNGLLVVFSCNTCPFVVGAEGYGEGWEGRYNDVYDYCKRHNVGMVLVNSNAAKRDGADSMDEMVAHAEKKKYKASYVVDANSKLADAFGARTTPHVYLFDGDMKLAYKGAIDDNNESASKVKSHYLQNAVEMLSAGKKIDPNSTRNIGCSIKRSK